MKYGQSLLHKIFWGGLIVPSTHELYSQLISFHCFSEFFHRIIFIPYLLSPFGMFISNLQECRMGNGYFLRCGNANQIQKRKAGD